jgi:glycosyltransferase involved in cell wall biosynthesis
MAEAMMCGTPVAATDIGATREVVDEGVTGCVAKSIDDLPAALEKAMTLDRAAVRRRAEARFSPQRMAQQHVEVYEQILRERR